MAFRFRKRIKIAPGIHVNVSKSGVSTTFGGRGASISVGPKGTYLNTSIPGTGLYNRQKIGGGTKSSSTTDYSPRTPKAHDNSGCFWFMGICAVVMLVFYVVDGRITFNTYLFGIFVSLVIWGVVLAIKPKSTDEDLLDSETNVDDTASDTSSKGEVSQAIDSIGNKQMPPHDGLTQDSFNLMQSEAIALYDFLKSATRSIKVRKELDRMMGLTNNDGSSWPLNNKITLTMLLDAYRCYKGLGYELNTGSNEELGLLLFANQVSTPGFHLDYSNLTGYKEKVVPSIREVFKTVLIVHNQFYLKEGQFFYQHIFENVNKERMTQYMVMLYRFASAIAKADNTISEEESEWLAELMKSKDLATDGTPLSIKADRPQRNKRTIDISDMDPLIKDVARLVVEKQNPSTSFVQRSFSMGYNRAGRIMDELEKIGVVGPARGSSPRELLCMSLEELDMLFAVSDETISDESIDDVQDVDHKEELQGLIGLASVKEEVEKLTNFIKIMNVRKKQKLPVSEISYHCVFTGNPGTGKTTVARIIANIYKELGVIKKGHLVETDRSGLVAEYVGQTAVKTNKIIDSALDGVLFIDEAYSLVTGSNNDYGTEAISTLLKRMEDDRSRLIVILAGYGDEMKTFIDSNPGLQSRFNRYINFPDYDAVELFAIYSRNLEKHKYMIEDDAAQHIKNVLANAVINKDKNFGNARFVRNLFEKTLENQAMRLAGVSSLTNEMLCTITKEDVVTLS